MPYKMLPVLEIDGKPVAQSNAVARYLAKKYDLMGRNEWDAMICDVLVDALGDLKQVLPLAADSLLSLRPSSLVSLSTIKVPHPRPDDGELQHGIAISREPCPGGRLELGLGM
ncbi:glutathione S-transferase-like [Bombus vancouverensis nearcticus]|uniref:glutathione S-transferase-like n=1 Tax=Bombus vancouverensis nearcticus TaxID=2705178 RepID=UPI00402B1103